MTRKTRYFLVGSVGLLLVGLGAGLTAYFAFQRAAGVPAGLAAELRFVPADAAVVAYADVHTVMQSDLRRELERITMRSRRGQQQMHDFAGIDLEKNIDHVIAYIQPEAPGASPDSALRALVLAQGTFDAASVEQFIKEHGGSAENYNGKQVFIRQAPSRGGRGRGPGPVQQEPPVPPAQPARQPETMAIAFVQPDLIAVGTTELVKRALDDSTRADNVTANGELMTLIREASSGDAWVVGRFDAVSRRMGLPASVRQQMPPLRLLSASAHVNGGLKATVKALTADQASADQLRDVIRGAISFARLQTGAKPELQEALKSIELGGTGTSVQVSFALTLATIQAIVPQGPQPPAAP